MDINSDYADKADKLRPIDFRYRFLFTEELLWNSKFQISSSVDFRKIATGLMEIAIFSQRFWLRALWVKLCMTQSKVISYFMDMTKTSMIGLVGATTPKSRRRKWFCGKIVLAQTISIISTFGVIASNNMVPSSNRLGNYALTVKIWVRLPLESPLEISSLLSP